MNKEGKEEEDGDRIYKEVEEEGWSERGEQSGDCHAVSVVATGAPLRSTIDFPRFFTPVCGAFSRKGVSEYVVNETRQSRLSSRLVKKTR